MPRYYCDYCDTYLTHDSPSVRKQHNAGYKHKGNVRMYYQQFEEQQTQILIDQRIKEHLGQTAAYQQLGTAGYNPRMLAPLPRPPILPTPAMPVMRAPPVLPRPPVTGYVQPMGMPLVSPSQFPGQVNVVPRPPPAGIAPINIPGSTAAPPPSSVTPSMMPHATYQANQALPGSGVPDSFNHNIPASAPEANHH